MAVQDLHVVAASQSFASTNDDSARFREQFPDSKIASSYSQHTDKSRHVIIYGIALYLKELLDEDVKDTFFCQISDETTTSQIKKQYDGHVIFFSVQYEQSVSCCSGCLFLATAVVKS